MVRVCHITDVHKPEDGRIFHKECCSLAEAGYEVYLVAQGESYNKNGVHIVGIGEKPQKKAKRMLSFAKKAYRKALELDCDIYHIHDPELLPYAAKLKAKGKKVIFDAHENVAEDISQKEWIPSMLRAAAYRTYKLLEKNNCKKMDAVISVTPDVCEYYESINPNTYMVTNYPVIKEKEAVLNKRKNTVCFAGTIEEFWNHDKLIDAIDEIDKCKYVLCGFAKENYLARLKTLKAWGKVDYLGQIPHEQVNGLLLKSNVGVALLEPSKNTCMRRGTLGNTKLFEEMMAELPVVCTDFDLWEEIIDKYHCGICVNPDNVEEIRDAINYLFDHPEEAEQMGKNGRKAVEEEYNWKSQEKVLLELYKSLLTTKK